MEINKEKYEKELDFWRTSNYDYITKNTKIKEENVSLIQINMKLKDKVEQLQDRIDKAIDFLESMDYCGQEDYFCDKTTVDADPNGNNNSYYDSAERLYKILKGE